MNDTTLFEAAAERQADGIARAVAHSGDNWVDYATRFVHDYCLTHPTVFCDDIWAAGLEVPASKRAFGQVMKHALKAGWIADAGTPRRSAASNNSWRTVYRSLIHRQTER